MNIEASTPKKPAPKASDDSFLDDLDFKPITSGLGFHHPQTTQEIKPIAPERPVMTKPLAVKPVQPDMNVYQNDLSMFYGHAAAAAKPAPVPEDEAPVERTYQKAARSSRVLAFVVDLLIVLVFLALTLTVMARSVDLDVIQIWQSFPNEVTPLVVCLFCGFYFMYFSVLEKSSGSTFGKNLLGIRVVGMDDKLLSFSALALRTFVTLLNFLSLGLFSYFNLQDRLSNSKVIRVD